jgi:hypothetical protein
MNTRIRVTGIVTVSRKMRVVSRLIRMAPHVCGQWSGDWK